MGICFSTTKGIVSTLLNKVIDEGLAKYDDPIAQYWPEFAVNGKSDLTIRQLLNHQTGIIQCSLPDHIPLWDSAGVQEYLAQSTPSQAYVGRPAYHLVSYGWLVGELIFRISGLTVSQLLDQVSTELDLDGLYIGVPEDQMSRVVPIITTQKEVQRVQKLGQPLGRIAKAVLSLLGVDTALIKNSIPKSLLVPGIVNDPRVIAGTMPSFNGVATARSLAKLYSVLANNGINNGRQWMSPETVERFSTAQDSRRDKIVKIKRGWRYGYHQLFSLRHSVNKGFGHFGFGGSGAWAEPERQLSMGLVVNGGVGSMIGQLRCYKLTQAVLGCVKA
jgi:CubicO group peptidase (beta-lactamase class C family)